jgi:hypothetical protein
MRMIRSSTTRRLVTGVSIIMLLLCQTVAAALAYAVATPVPPAQSAALGVTPCHHDAMDTGGSQTENGCQDRCPSRYSSVETAKVNIPAADNVALTVFSAALPRAAATLAAPYEHILALAAPPPLILVYCRLLI